MNADSSTLACGVSLVLFNFRLSFQTLAPKFEGVTIVSFYVCMLFSFRVVMFGAAD